MYSIASGWFEQRMLKRCPASHLGRLPPACRLPTCRSALCRHNRRQCSASAPALRNSGQRCGRGDAFRHIGDLAATLHYRCFCCNLLIFVRPRFICLHGDHSWGKSGNVGEFDSCQRNIGKINKS